MSRAMPMPKTTVPVVRRLTNDDVRTIFDCIFNNKKPDDGRLAFKIIVVGPSGMKLSPPPLEYEDGLYVLLKPLKKPAKNERVNYGPPEEDPRIPSELKSMVFTDNPPSSCPWSLSGPQFPVPTAIQQRYCYPRGDPDYSTMKGGALWTTYDEHGKEDLEFRLLHVYYSAKRASSGRRSVSLARSISSAVPSGRRIKKKQRKSIRAASPPSSPRSLSSGSFDSVLSFDEPMSPEVDPSIFSMSTFFANTFSKDDGEEDNENDKIITPDRIFDTDRRIIDNASSSSEAQHTNNSNRQYYPSPRNNLQSRHPGTYDMRNTRSQSYAMQPYSPHYYHNYPYWPPHSSSGTNSQQSGYRMWNGTPYSSNQYPIQEARIVVAKKTSSDDVIAFLDSTENKLQKMISSAAEKDQEGLMEMVMERAKKLSGPNSPIDIKNLSQKNSGEKGNIGALAQI